MKIYSNFKMNKTSSEIKRYFYEFVPLAEKIKHEFTFMIPFTSLELGKFLTEGTNIKIGAQNLCEDEVGENTGEISASMLKDVGAQSVLVGHYERRTKYKETSRVLNKKITLALKNGLEVILCVGETQTERNTLKGRESLQTQIEEALKGLYENELDNIVIAYEPVWAVGTGTTPTAKEIEKAANAIRKVIADDFSVEAGEKINVVYGGSLNEKNIALVSKISLLDGVLIGNSALKCENLVKMAKALPVKAG